jgi:PAS domain S-box-containing protein
MSRRDDERPQPEYQKRGNDSAKARRDRGSIFAGLSIRTRLLISTGAVLVTIIAAMIWVGYRQVSVSANDLGRERLRSLTQQFVSISQQTIAAGLNRSSNVANDAAVRAFVKSPSDQTKGSATQVIEQQLALAQDPANVQVELWNSDRSLALVFPENAAPVDPDLSADFARCSSEPFRAVGLLREFRGALVGNLTAAVRDENGKPIGFLVRWRRISITPGPAQLRALLGDDAALYFGNANKEGWTDLTKVIPKPQVAQYTDAIEYNRGGRTMMAMARSIDGTPWAIAIEISTHALAGQTRAFLRRTALISMLILFVGMVAAFLLARSMTRPLLSLTQAASAIAGGDYSQKVEINRSDELGTLARAFNAMTAKVSNSQRELEQKVKERTAQLEAAAGAILIIDRSGTIKTANRKAEVLFGYGEDELTAKLVDELVPVRYRSGHEALRDGFFVHPEARPMGGGRELFGLRRDGSEVPIEIGLNPIRTDEGVFVLANIIDITARRRAEEQFRIVVEASPNAILMVNAEGRISLVNTQTERLFGYTRTELIGQPMEILTPERYRRDHPQLRSSFFLHPSTRAMGAGRDLYGRRKDGTEVPIEIGLNPINTSEGMYVLASIIDISERKRREEQLHLQSTALEFAANAIVITDVNGKIVWVNKAFTETTGYSAEEVVGENPRILKSGELDGSFYKEMWETILSGKVWRNTVVNRRKDGSLNREDMTITPISDGAGKISHFVAIKQDITEKTRAQEALQASELRYRRLFESAKDGILILDAGNGQIVDVNPYLVEMLGYAKEELIGKELWEIGVFKDVVASKDAFVELQSQGYIRYEDLPLRTHRGIVKQVEFVSNSYLAGPLRVIQCNIRDITERKLAEEALRQSNQHLQQTLAELRERNNEITAMTQQLWQASKLATVGELAASIAHELNNPLATISLRLETLGAQLADDEQKHRAVEIVADEVERMGKLVGNLLQFSRRSHPQISTLYVREEIDRSLELVEYHLRSHGIQVTREYPAGLYAIQADRQQLRQVFLNLLTNASDALTQGGQIKVRVTADSENYVRIEFMDNGAGIPPASLEKIWDPFFTTKAEGKGTGLGLAICRRVIEEHRGSISIDSRVGEGTTVTILLPTSKNVQPVDAKAEPLT